MAFTYSEFNDEKAGCKPTTLITRDYSADAILSDKLVKYPETTDQFVLAKSSPDSMEWKDKNGDVSVIASFTSEPSLRRIVLHVENLSYTKQITQLDVQLPRLTMTLSADNKIYTGFHGGGPGSLGFKDWPSGQGTSGYWPGYCTSPLTTIYNEKTGETLAITFFNDQLMQGGLYWFSGPGGAIQALNPFYRFAGELEPRCGMTLPIEFREMSGGPPAHWKHYREDILKPFMTSLGFPESGELETTSNVWGTGTDSGAGLALAVRRLVARYRIDGYVQWPASDGRGIFYEPHAVKYPFFSEFLMTSQIAGLKHFGTLAIPDLTPFIPTDMALRQMWGDPPKQRVLPESVLVMNQRADLTRQYNLSYARILRDHGVTIIYYDAGGGPYRNQRPLDWLRTYADFKNAGIAVMGECGADVTSWISGAWFEYPYSWNDYSMLKTVLPGCGLFAFQHTADTHDVGNGPESWWRNAIRKGITPLLSEDELALWAAGK
jgi:hypothetical protein